MPSMDREAVANERLKLAAAALNTLATAAIVTGVIAQLAPGTFGLGAPPQGVVRGLLTWGTVGLYLHGMGHWLLGGIRA